jgi:FKBP-type peptidyl-prolyl cis-trans isomerase
MSAVVKTITPFIDKECLLKALDKLQIRYSINGNQIVSQNQNFIYRNGHYTLDVYSHNYQPVNWNDYKNNNKFLETIETEYNKFYAEKLAEIERKRQQALAEAERKRLEEEAKRIEAERKAFVEKQKKTIIEKAKAKGYSVKEKKVGNKIKLVLVRHTY